MIITEQVIMKSIAFKLTVVWLETHCKPMCLTL